MSGRAAGKLRYSVARLEQGGRTCVRQSCDLRSRSDEFLACAEAFDVTRRVPEPREPQLRASLVDMFNRIRHALTSERFLMHYAEC
jgi:hypothetical protein